MPTTYDDAVAELYQAPHASFIAERKRLAADLKAAGDRPAATKLGKLPRPPISAWAVNQLWWHARDAFDQLFETAQRLRGGDLGATTAHREAIAKLRARATAMLADAGHAATEATLRKVTTTLAALAATGGFEPDPPGALASDRDPPGFEAAGIFAAADGGAPADDEAAAPKPGARPKPTDDETDGAKTRRAEAEQRRRAEAEEKRAQAEAATERRRAEQAAAKRAQAQHQLEAALRTARGEVERRTRELDRLRKAVTDAEGGLEKAQAIVDDLEAKLATLVEESEA
jgi:hypothetical protein